MSREIKKRLSGYFSFDIAESSYDLMSKDHEDINSFDLRLLESMDLYDGCVSVPSLTRLFNLMTKVSRMHYDFGVCILPPKDDFSVPRVMLPHFENGTPVNCKQFIDWLYNQEFDLDEEKSALATHLDLLCMPLEHQTACFDLLPNVRLMLTSKKMKNFAKNKALKYCLEELGWRNYFTNSNVFPHWFRNVFAQRKDDFQKIYFDISKYDDSGLGKAKRQP